MSDTILKINTTSPNIIRVSDILNHSHANLSVLAGISSGDVGFNFSQLGYAITTPADTTTPLIDSTTTTWAKVTLTANRTLTFNIPVGEFVFTTIIPGAFAATWTNVNEWVGGAAPTTLGTEALFMFWSDDGSTVSGSYIGDIS